MTNQTPQTTPQKVFTSTIEEYQNKYDPENDIELPYWYHDGQTVSVDGYLWQILNDVTEYGYGDELYKTLRDNLYKIGYMLENINGCDFGFYKI